MALHRRCHCENHHFLHEHGNELGGNSPLSAPKLNVGWPKISKANFPVTIPIESIKIHHQESEAGELVRCHHVLQNGRDMKVNMYRGNIRFSMVKG